MEWMNQLSGLLGQYAGGQGQATDTAHDDFTQLAQHAPSSAIADGLAAAFRSDQTPAFGQMAAQLFNNSNGQQRAGILNMLLQAAGPAILSQVLSSRAGGSSSSSSSSGGAGGGLSSLIGLLGGSGGGQTQITPEQAEQIPAEAVQEIAEHAEKRDPSVIDQVSGFYAEHPTLVKSLGAAALTIALSKIAQSQYS
jgi:hypothetical protein